MRIWILKAIVQKTLSFLPFSHQLNFLFQKHITKGLRLSDALLEDKLEHCKHHLENFEQHGSTPFPEKVLELGTGWFPVIPIGLYLSGAKNIVTVDITPLLKAENVWITFQRILEYEQKGKLKQWLPNIQAERLANLQKIVQQQQKIKDTLHLSDLLEPLHISSMITDARQLKLANNSIDLFVSNNTFEHIFESVLVEILQEFKRVAKNHAVMSHFIDMSDHFSHLDKSITNYNFLQYSPKIWKIIDNDIQPQNRLRINKHRSLLHKAGFKIVGEQNRSGSQEDLAKVVVDKSFADIPQNDLMITHSLLVAKLVS